MSIANDIIIFGYKTDGSDHDITVRSVMKMAKKVGMHFNPAKCQFRKTEVKFFGMPLKRQGMVPKPAKVDSLNKSPEPRTETLLKSSLGMVNYLSWFDPKIANLTHNLRALLKKANEFNWTDVHSKDFKVIIQTPCSNQKLLHYYRPEPDLYL